MLAALAQTFWLSIDLGLCMHANMHHVCNVAVSALALQLPAFRWPLPLPDQKQTRL